jgi:hypothetical protein
MWHLLDQDSAAYKDASYTWCYLGTKGAAQGLFGARVASRRTCQKKNLAPIARLGAKMLFGAHCAEALAHIFHGAALSKRRSKNTQFPVVFPSRQRFPNRDCDPQNYMYI